MRFVVVGPGAIGGVMGGLLHRAGHQVELVARGAHLEAIRRQGLVLEVPGQTFTLSLAAVAKVGEVDWSEPAVVVLAVKSQHTAGLLDELAAAAPADTPVVCAQNGVDNERQALRLFANTYAMCVMCPATHLRPGVVQAHSAPVPGMLDLGRYPSGVDQTAQGVAEAVRSAGFDSRVLPSIMRWKYRKLLMNLYNATGALFGTQRAGAELNRLIEAEGEAVLAAAGIEFASKDEDQQRRGSLLQMEPTASGPWSGSSSWQSVARGAGSIETDYLNGEISLLGRLHDVATPVNDLVRQHARRLAEAGGQPGAITPEELLGELAGAPSPS